MKPRQENIRISYIIVFERLLIKVKKSTINILMDLLLFEDRTNE